MDIYAGGISNLTEARYFSSREVAMVGIKVDGEKITPELFVEIKDWLEGPLVVAELAADKMKDEEFLSALQADYILLDDPNALQGYSENVILRLTDQTISGDIPSVEAYIISHKEWKANESKVKDLISNADVYLEISDASQMNDLPEGVAAVCIGAEGEEKTGLKDFTELSELLDAIQGEA